MKWSFLNSAFAFEFAATNAVFFSCYFFGQYWQDWIHENVGFASWRSPKFLGNNGRSPIYPYFKNPHWDDYEGRLDSDRKY